MKLPTSAASRDSREYSSRAPVHATPPDLHGEMHDLVLHIPVKVRWQTRFAVARSMFPRPNIQVRLGVLRRSRAERLEHMYIREVAPTEPACCMRSCIRPVRLIQSWLRRKRARSQRCSFESPSVAYDSPEHCQSTKHGSTSNRTTSQKIKVRVYLITCPLCKGLVTSERMGGTADVRVRNMGTIYASRPAL